MIPNVCLLFFHLLFHLIFPFPFFVLFLFYFFPFFISIQSFVRTELHRRWGVCPCKSTRAVQPQTWDHSGLIHHHGHFYLCSYYILHATRDFTLCGKKGSFFFTISCVSVATRKEFGSLELQPSRQDCPYNMMLYYRLNDH